MKHTRLLPCLLACLLVFTSTITVVKPDTNSPESLTEPALSAQDHPAAQHITADGAITTTGSCVTIFLHGLMVGHYNKDDKNFKLGVVKNALGHNFDFNVFVPGAHPILYRIPLPDKGKWVFEVKDRKGKPIESATKPAKTSIASSQCDEASFSDIPEFRDSDHILDVEVDLHNERLGRRGGLFGNPFSRIFRFHNVDPDHIKTEVMTRNIHFLNLETGDEDIQHHPPKAIAEVAGIEFNLSSDQQLVMTEKKSGKVIWTNVYGENTGVEGRIIHLPHDPAYEVSYGKMPYKMAASTVCPITKTISLSKFLKLYFPELLDKYFPELKQAASLASAETEPIPSKCVPNGETHFQLYYQLVFDVEHKKRFELCNEYPYCLKLEDDRKNKSTTFEKTVPPYRCGIVLSGLKDVD